MMLPVAKRKRRKAPRQGRLSWDGRLWDRQEVEYDQVEEELTKDRATAIVVDETVAMAISRWSEPLRWPTLAERQRVWRDEIEPNFHDQPRPKRPGSERGQLPFHPELWTAHGSLVLLITDRD